MLLALYVQKVLTDACVIYEKDKHNFEIGYEMENIVVIVESSLPEYKKACRLRQLDLLVLSNKPKRMRSHNSKITLNK